MSRIALLGTGYSAIPLYECLRGKHEVFPIGNRENDPLARESNHVFVDYSDVAAMRSLVKELTIDYIVPSCNDAAYNTAIEIKYDKSEHLKLRKLLLDKWNFRQFFKGEDFNIPFVSIEDLRRNPDALDGCVLLKPTSSHSGIGIHKAQKKEIADILELLGKTQDYFAEKFVSGSLHSHSAFFEDGKILADFVVDEYCGKFDFAVSESKHPSELPKEIKKRLKFISEVVAQKLHFQSGLLHSQFIFDGVDCWLLESMSRCPGDFFGTLIEKSTGFHYYDSYLSHFVEEKMPSFTKSKLELEAVARFTVYPSQKGRLEEIHLGVINEGITEIQLLPFDSLYSVANLGRSGKVGITFAKFENITKMEECFEKLRSLKVYSR